jgi:hypothetical protein
VVVGDDSILAHESRYFVGDHRVAQSFAAVVPPAPADLVDVAMAVYAADRLVRRPSRLGNPSEHRWHRRLAIEVEVRQPHRWRRTEVQERLTELLEFLTEDSWDLTFQKSPKEVPVEGQQWLFQHKLPEPVAGALFSGGLDSLAAIDASSSVEDARRGVEGLLQRYCNEWNVFRSRPPGWEAV